MILEAPHQYWVQSWLDEHDIRTLGDAQKKLSEWRVFDELKQIASEAHARPKPTIHRPDTAILAGRGIDLSGDLTCRRPACRRREVDELFASVWHYFDEIVVADVLTPHIAHYWKQPTEPEIEWFLSHLNVLLYLREIGAEDLIQFVEKAECHPQIWRVQADHAGIISVLDKATFLIDQLVREGVLTVTKQHGSREYILNHPILNNLVNPIQLDRRKSSQMSVPSIKHALAELSIAGYISSLSSDVKSSRELGLPIGTTIELYRDLITGMTSETAIAEIAFSLDLPVLSGVSAEDVIRLRTTEYDSFLRFQHRLRTAADEYRKNHGSSDAASIALEIKSDVIDPELGRIKDSLEAAASVFARKSSVAIGLTFLATMVGIGVGAPYAQTVAVAAGAMAAAAATAYGKYVEETRDLALGDMWFLWKAIDQHVLRKQ